MDLWFALLALGAVVMPLAVAWCLLARTQRPTPPDPPLRNGRRRDRLRDD